MEVIKKRRMVVTIVLMWYCTLSLTLGQSCTQTVSPLNYVAFPSLVNSIPVIHPGVSGCKIFQAETFNCSYNVVLGDGIIFPSSPLNLNNADYVMNFITWKRGGDYSYIDFDFFTTLSQISKIELKFLNSPTAHGISLPDFELFEIVRGTGTTVVTYAMSSILTDNEDLSQSDRDNQQIRSVSLRPAIRPQAGIIIRINISFNETYDNLEWFFLSEVIFCTDTLQPVNVIIAFASPASDIVIQPSPETLRNGSTELLCTVSSQGLYRWQWKRDGSLIENGGSKYHISVGEGSRTTWLRISDLGFSDAGRYECKASTMDISNRVITDTRMQDIEFPVNVVTAQDMTGFRDTGEVVLSCELHGYLTTVTPPIWLNGSMNEISVSSKYAISRGEGLSTIVFENGTAIPSMTVQLTVLQLGPEDAGNYTCTSGAEVSVTQLTILEGTPPPTNTVSSRVQRSPTDVTEINSSSLFVGVFFIFGVEFVIVILMSAFITALCYIFWRRKNANGVVNMELNVQEPTEGDDTLKSNEAYGKINRSEPVDIVYEEIRDVVQYQNISEIAHASTIYIQH